MTSIFGPRTSPITGKSEIHRGQDIVTDANGDWTVREVTGGTVLRVSSDQWRGLYVDVQTAPGVFERYQHMDSIYVKAGQKVPQGAHLGLAGSTGDVTGRHLHFGVYVGGTAEACAVEPSQWSGVPNKVGSYAGNNDYDGEAAPPAPAGELVRLLAGPMSDGDRKKFEELAKQLGVGLIVYDGDADGSRTAAVTSARVTLAAAEQTVKDAQQVLKDLGVT